MRLALPALVMVAVAVTVVLGSLYDEGGFDSALLLVCVWAVLGAVIAALRPRSAVAGSSSPSASGWASAWP